MTLTSPATGRRARGRGGRGQCGERRCPVAGRGVVSHADEPGRVVGVGQPRRSPRRRGGSWRPSTPGRRWRRSTASSPSRARRERRPGSGPPRTASSSRRRHGSSRGVSAGGHAARLEVEPVLRCGRRPPTRTERTHGAVGGRRAQHAAPGRRRPGRKIAVGSMTPPPPRVGHDLGAQRIGRLPEGRRDEPGGPRRTRPSRRCRPRRPRSVPPGGRAVEVAAPHPQGRALFVGQRTDPMPAVSDTGSPGAPDAALHRREHGGRVGAPASPAVGSSTTSRVPGEVGTARLTTPCPGHEGALQRHLLQGGGVRPRRPCQAWRMTSSVPGLNVPETTRRCPPRSSAHSSRPAPWTGSMTRLCTRGSSASRPRGGHVVTRSRAGRRLGEGEGVAGRAPSVGAAAPGLAAQRHQPTAPAASAAAPTTTTERRRTDWRWPSTRAAGSGGSPCPASSCSTTASRSTSSAQSAGSRPSAARAASWAAVSRPRRAAARARTSATGIPSRSATSSGPAAHTDPAPTTARSSGVASRTTCSRAIEHRVVVGVGVGPRGGGGHGIRPPATAAATAAVSTERRAVAPGRPSSRDSRQRWCSPASASVVTRRADRGRG